MKIEYKRITGKVGMQVMVIHELPDGNESVSAMHISDWDTISKEKQDEYIDELVLQCKRNVVEKYRFKIWCDVCQGMRLVDVPVDSQIKGTTQQVCFKCKGKGYVEM